MCDIEPPAESDLSESPLSEDGLYSRIEKFLHVDQLTSNDKLKEKEINCILNNMETSEVGLHFELIYIIVIVLHSCECLAFGQI